ncbi:MAG: CsbD family protein [Alphaproteobacteria bacterium]
MNSDQIKGDWKQLSGRLKETWGALTDDDIARINGQRDQLIGKLQSLYGISKEEAEKQVSAFEDSL